MTEQDTGADHEAQVGVSEAVEASDDGQGKKRRRGKRGGKRNRREDGEGVVDAGTAESADASESEVLEGVAVSSEPEVAATPVEEPVALAPANDDTPSVEKPKKPRRAAKPKKAAADVVAEAPVAEPEAPAEPPPPVSEETAAAAVETPKVRPSRRKPVPVDAPIVPIVSSTVADEAKTEEKPKRAGWWQKKGFF